MTVWIAARAMMRCKRTQYWRRSTLSTYQQIFPNRCFRGLPQQISLTHRSRSSRSVWSSKWLMAPITPTRCIIMNWSQQTNSNKYKLRLCALWKYRAKALHNLSINIIANKKVMSLRYKLALWKRLIQRRWDAKSKHTWMFMTRLSF